MYARFTHVQMGSLWVAQNFLSMAGIYYSRRELEFKVGSNVDLDTDIRISKKPQLEMAITSRDLATSLLIGALVLLFIVITLVPDNVSRIRFKAIGKHDPIADRPLAFPIPPASEVLLLQPKYIRLRTNNLRSQESS